MVTMTKRFTESNEITTTTLTALQSVVVASCAIVGVLVYPPIAEIVLPVALKF
jgi:hypothetical protein